jgi:hypothetical protein
MEWKLINSKLTGQCVVCQGEIETGDRIYWKRRQAIHESCMNGQAPAPEAAESAESKAEKVRPLGNIRYVAPSERARPCGMGVPEDQQEGQPGLRAAAYHC